MNNYVKWLPARVVTLCFTITLAASVLSATPAAAGWTPK